MLWGASIAVPGASSMASCVALAKRLVAEGAETTVQADLLQGLGVNELQGYLYGKPQTPAELARSWREYRPLLDSGGTLT